jgi:hypothetical protein
MCKKVFAVFVENNLHALCKAAHDANNLMYYLVNYEGISFLDVSCKQLEVGSGYGEEGILYG